VGGTVAGGSPEPGTDGGALGGGGVGVLGGGAGLVGGGDGRGLLDELDGDLGDGELDGAPADEEPADEEPADEEPADEELDEDDEAVVLLRVGSATVAGSSSRSRRNSSAPIPAITSTPTTVRTTARFRLLSGAGRPYPPGCP
jgi:hypothetical protein